MHYALQIIIYLCNQKGCNLGGASAIEIHFIALDLHEVCQVKIKLQSIYQKQLE